MVVPVGFYTTLYIVKILYGYIYEYRYTYVPHINVCVIHSPAANLILNLLLLPRSSDRPCHLARGISRVVFRSVVGQTDCY